MSAMSLKLQNLLAQPGHAGIYHLPSSDRKALKTAALALGFGWLQSGFGGKRELAPILAKLGKDLRLPDWYGENLDALADCLTDLSWNAAPGYVLLIEGAEALHARDEASFGTLNKVFASIIADWQEEKVPFWVFYVFDNGRSNGLAELPPLLAG